MKARSVCATLATVWLSLAGVAAAQRPPPDFTGVWSGSFTAQDHEFWQVEDFTICFAGCSPASRRFFAGLLDDPANDERSVRELWRETTAFARRELAEKSTEAGLALQAASSSENDPTILCESYGLVRQATNPLPLRIGRQGDDLVFVYEEWNLSRTIYMDGRGHPQNLAPTQLGYSIGRHEDGALVVETAGIEADIYFPFQSSGGFSERARVVERYTVEDEPRRLVLELSVTDPVTLTEPHAVAKTWLYMPDLEMIEDSCEDIPAQF
jgi:hypothetical protein